MHLVDLRRGRAFEQQLHRLHLTRLQHAVADEAVAHTRDHRDLADLLTRSHRGCQRWLRVRRSEEHTSELQSLMRISYAVFCLKTKNNQPKHLQPYYHTS